MEMLQSGLVMVLNVSSMLAMGLALTPAQVAAALRHRRPVVIGLALNLLAMPLLAWLLSAGAGLAPAVALGFLLCAAAPGGNTGPLLTANANGDTAYSVALVVILSFASVLTVPLALYLLAGGGAAAAAVPVGTIVLLILLFQIAPLCVGMVAHRLRPARATQAATWVRRLANASLGLLTVLLIVLKGDLLAGNGWLPLILMEVFVVAALAGGLLLGPPANPRTRALGMTTCTRNLSLALLLGAQVFDDAATMIAVLSYGLLWVGTSVPVGLWLRRRPIAAG